MYPTKRHNLDWLTLESALRLMHAIGGRLALTHDQRALIPSEVATYFERAWVPLEMASHEPQDREWQIVKRGPNYSLERLDSKYSYQMAFARAPHFREALVFARIVAEESQRVRKVAIPA